MDEVKLGRRERRRRKTEVKMEGNRPVENEFQKTIENFEFSIKSQSSAKLVRRDTYTVFRKKNEFEIVQENDIEKDLSEKSAEGFSNDSAESKNLTYSLDKDSDSLKHCTYNIDKSADELQRPVPAPRKWKSANLEPEKVSSDTDRDITEIDLDDLRLKSPKSEMSSKPSPDGELQRKENDLAVPIPKPRKSVRKNQKTDSDSQKSKSEASPVKSQSSKERLNQKTAKSDENSKTFEESTEHPEVPLVENLQEEAKMAAKRKQKTKKERKLIGDLLDRKKNKKKSKTFSSLMKLEKSKMPKISFILKDLKEEKNKENKLEVEEDKTEVQIDSPHYGESVHNGQIYVQSKNGFRVMEREEVLKKGKQNGEADKNSGLMENSTVKTAILLQKYWSRSMTYFHGVLAGFGFSHAATVTAIMLHCNYEPQGFISVYSCLSLKIHYVFYALTSFCIVSCFDRIDIGHMNRSHWDTAWKSPSMWIVLVVYVISFVLTFANQITETRFDAYPDGNETEIWEGHTQNQIQVVMFQWYHSVWARDMLVLLAWLIISLTEFEDYLHSHINNMAKYAEMKEGTGLRHKIDYF